MMALATAGPEPVATSTATPGLTPHWAFASAKNLRPQFTVVSVPETTWLMAAVTSAHFDLAPQPPLQVASFWSSSIEPERSWTIRMSGGSGMIGTVAWPQFIIVPALPVMPMSPPVSPWPVVIPETPPDPTPLPVLEAPPVPLSSPGVPGEKAQPTSGTNDKRPKRIWCGKRCMGGPPERRAFRVVSAIAYAVSLGKVSKSDVRHVRRGESKEYAAITGL